MNMGENPLCASADADRERLLKELRKKDLLLQISTKVQARVEVRSVLAAVMDSMNEMFPDMTAELYLAQDTCDTDGLPVRMLDYRDAKENLCIRSFMEEKLLAESVDGSVQVAAPLAGNQGVYGVLRLARQGGVLPGDDDLQFISSIVKVAGTAFENAKLYEHCNLVINELRVINEITRQLNKTLKLDDVYRYALEKVRSILSADFACILSIDQESRKMIVRASKPSVIQNEMFDITEGFSGIVYSTGEPLIVPDCLHYPHIRSAFVKSTGARSLLAAPILSGEETIGIVLVAHREPNYFSYDNFKLLRVLAGQIGLAITNAALHAEMRRMVITDQLTGLYTRHYLDELINEFQKKDDCGSLILLDVDFFKRINDTYGHQVGDQVLVQIAGIVKKCIRESDIAARWGGEELAVYLPRTGKDRAVWIAERMRARIYTETNPRVSVSCGLAEWNRTDEKISVEHLFYQADMNMYTAKRDGRNQVRANHS